MKEHQLDHEQRSKAKTMIKKQLQLSATDSAKHLQKKMQGMVEKYKDHDDNDDDENMPDEQDDTVGMITEEELKMIQNPAKILKSEAPKQRKRKKEDAKSNQERKKQKLEQRNKLIAQVDAGTFTIDHEAQAYQRRDFTVAIAIPGSILHGLEFRAKTTIAAQLARICALHRIDEVIIYNEDATTEMDTTQYLANMRPESIELLKNVELDKTVEKKLKEKQAFMDEQKKNMSWSEEKQQTDSQHGKKKKTVFKKNHILKVEDDSIFLANVLYYMETPTYAFFSSVYPIRYMRSLVFPLADFIKESDILHPMTTVHHQLASEVLRYRDGVVTNERNTVYVGLPKLVVIDEKLEPGTRVTVFIERTYSYYYYGQVIPQGSPKQHDGLYWGYKVRLASSLSAIWTESPHEIGYDVTVGTSEKGSSIEQPNFKFPKFRHMVIVFGGSGGIEKAVEKDATVKHMQADKMFDKWYNLLPHQGLSSVRTEEAIFCGLGALGKHLNVNVPPQPQNLRKQNVLPWKK